MKLTESQLRKYIRTLLLKEAESTGVQYVTKASTRNPKYVDVFISSNGKERLLGTFVSDEKAAAAIKKDKLAKRGASIDRSIKKQPTGIEESGKLNEIRQMSREDNARVRDKLSDILRRYRGAVLQSIMDVEQTHSLSGVYQSNVSQLKRELSEMGATKITVTKIKGTSLVIIYFNASKMI